MGSTSTGQQFKALLKRNLLIMKRNPIYFVLGFFVVPLGFLAVIVVIKAVVPTQTFPQISKFPQTSLNDPRFTPQGPILVAPNTPEVEKIMNIASGYWNNSASPKYLMFADGVALEDAYRGNTSAYNLGVIFSDDIPNNASYKIRTQYKMTPPLAEYPRPLSSLDCRISRQYSCPANNYLYSGFSALQLSIDMALIQTKTNYTIPSPQVTMEMMPKPEFTPDLSWLQGLLALMIVFVYLPIFTRYLLALVMEKKKKYRDSMLMMGMKLFPYWLSWCVLYLTIIFITSLLFTAMLMIGQIFTNSNFFWIFLLLFLFGLSGLTFTYMFSTFFRNEQLATILGFFIFMVFGLLYYAVMIPRSIGNIFPEFGLWLLCLLPQAAICIGVDQAIFVDQKAADGLTTSTLNFVTEMQNISVGSVMLMLFLDTILYLLLGAWLENVIPNEYGKRKSFLFFLNPSYWFASSHVDRDHSNHMVNAEVCDDIEEVSPELRDKQGIKIFNLKKAFTVYDEVKRDRFGCKVPKENWAVNGISLNMYEGQITALLGHNGAGKTTLINMMTGLMEPTNGACTIFNQDVQDDGDMQRIQSMLGVCPQHNVLFDDLSVVQHLEFFANLKGMSPEQVKEEVRRIVDLIDLPTQKHALTKELSGGQKRKLSVGIALIGDPKVIFLDEPTAGMDPYSRRKLWTLLKKVRPGKIILLTTHFMDEADILADRKAIISKGKLRCCGSSMYLKNKFGIGYRLNMVIDIQKCHSEKVTQLILTHITEAKLTRTHGMELTYTLPMNATESFPDLFSALEGGDGHGSTMAKAMGIQSYGISMPTLEEVFLKLAEEAEHTQEDHDIQVALDTYLNQTNGLSQSKAELLNLNMEDGNGVHSGPQITNRKVDKVAKQRFLTLIKYRTILQFRVGWFIFIRMILPLVLGIGGAAMFLIPTAGNKDFSNPENNTDLGSTSQYATAKSPLLYINSTGSSLDFFLNNLNSSGLEHYSAYNDSVSLLDVPSHYMAYNISQIDILSKEIWYAFTAMYNDSALHALPAMFNTWANTLYTSVNASDTWKIQVSSQAFPDLNPQTSFDSRVFNAVRLLALGLAFLGGFFGVEIIEDRTTKCRTQLRVAGVSSTEYWMHFLVVHGIQILVMTSIITIVTLSAFDIPEYATPGARLCFVLVVILYAPLMLLFGYSATYLFEKTEVASNAVVMYISIFSIVPYVVVSLIEPVNAEVAGVLHYIFCIVFPIYTACGGLHYTAKVYGKAALLGNQGNIETADYFKVENHVIMTIVIMVLQCLLWLFLLRFADVRSGGGSVRDVFLGSRQKGQDTEWDINDDKIENEDSDVAEEREKVAKLETNSSGEDAPVVVVKNLRKEFEKRTGGGCCRAPGSAKVKVAVRNLSFAVSPGEVFGLLGHNGAGKTTTLNTMTGEYAPTKGKVTVAGYDITSNISDAFQNLGLCPQFDAIFRLLTLEEHIALYAALHGMDKDDIKACIQFYLKSLQIEEHAKKLSANLSGGTKRKLSFVISMLGYPKIVLMDEPSTGMDPATKRFLWDTITTCFSGNMEKGAILTTHYMEEADALCTRIGVMVAGELRCLGPTQHLKAKHGGGYSLEVKVRSSDPYIGEDQEIAHLRQMDALKNMVKDIFPNMVMLEQFGDRAQFKIPQADVQSLGETFAALEQGKQTIGIEEYSFSQSTLEQVFVEFAKSEYESVEQVKGVENPMGPQVTPL